ncbi:Tyrosinase-like protein orsC [Botrytis cinerea]
MHFLYFGALSILLVLQPCIDVAEAASYPRYAPDAVDKLAAKGLAKLAAYQAINYPHSTCTIKNAIKRREWSDLSGQDRIAYTNAVLCLQSKEPITPSEVVPGVRSRFDDFVAAHINQSFTIHGTGNFLGWHRYYVHTYEKALREECGYKGYQPYWNWGRYADDPIHSPLFDGSPTSMSGNGLYYNHTGVPINLAPAPFDIIPPGVGGGCVTTGPFKNMTVHLGPVFGTISGTPVNPQADGFGYNPRCLRRDVNVHSAAVTKTNYTYDLITNPSNADIYWFQTVMQGLFSIGEWGVHTGGHYTVGGDPGGDFFTSSGDPAFYLHHGMIDRVWWIWQLQDLAKRQDAVSGTITLNNVPPSRNTTLEDLQDIGYNAGPVPLQDLMNTLGGLNGELCYIYV